MATSHYQTTPRSPTRMNRTQALQDVVDSLLIEGLARQEFGLSKQAGLFDDLNLAGVGESIKSFVKSHVNNDGPGGYLGSVLNLLAPSVLFKVNPFLGILYLVGTQFGFDFQSVMGKFADLIKSHLQSGQAMTSEDVSSMGKAAVASQVSEAMPSDLLEPLRKYASQSRSELLKEAQMMSELQEYLGRFNPLAKKSPSFPTIPWLFSNDKSVIGRIFGNLLKLPTRGKAKWMMGGFIIWIVKAVLMGAGLIAGAEAISGLLGHKKPEALSAKPIETPSTPPESSSIIQEPKSISKTETLPSLIDSSKEMWVVPLIGSIAQTLEIWTADLYPKTKTPDLAKKLANSSKFRATLQELSSQATNRGSKSLVMPEQFTSRKQVVDQFIQDIL